MAMSGTTKFLVVVGVAAVTIAGMGFGLNALSGGYAENVAATEIAPLVDEVAGDEGRVVCELGDPGTTDFLSANNIPWAQRAIVVDDTSDLDDRVIRIAADAGFDLAEVPESTDTQNILEGTTDGVTLTVGVLRVGDWDAGCGAIDVGDGEAIVQMTIDFPPTN